MNSLSLSLSLRVRLPLLTEGGTTKQVKSGYQCLAMQGCSHPQALKQSIILFIIRLCVYVHAHTWLYVQEPILNIFIDR